MHRKRTPIEGSQTRTPTDMLREFVGLFENRGWLGQDIRIRRNGVGYRIFCSRTQFYAYRLNDRWALSPGIPGWPVCSVSETNVFHDRDLSMFSSMEPSIEDWLTSIANDDFEVV